MFERFTERSRQVVVLAQDEARAFKHNYIGTEHILLGLLREEEGLAAHVLESLDITLEGVRAEVTRIVGQGEEVATGQVPFTPRAKKVLELSLREALSLGHSYIGTEHILLGVVRENEGVAARILLDFDADAEKIRNQIIRLLSGPEWHDPQEPDVPAAYAPSSPPLAPEFVADLERLRSEKEAAMSVGDHATAARLRGHERRLLRAANRLERVWRNEEPAEPQYAAESTARPPRRVPLRAWRPSVAHPSNAWLLPLAVGWALFGVTLAVGVVLGWLIWA